MFCDKKEKNKNQKKNPPPAQETAKRTKAHSRGPTPAPKMPSWVKKKWRLSRVVKIRVGIAF